MSYFSPATFSSGTTYPRIPVAVDCWFPTGKQTKPIIRMLKFKEPEGDIITVNEVTNLYSEQSVFYGTSIVEFKCQFIYQNRMREVALCFTPHELKWEMVFIN